MAQESALAASVSHVLAHSEFESRFKHPLKFNGLDYVQVRLSPKEVRGSLEKLVQDSLHVFLERYGDLLTSDFIDAIAALPQAAAPEVQHYVERLRARSGAKDQSDKVRWKIQRRRRWAWARREMERPGGFFDEDEMRSRAPRLCYDMVGNHVQRQAGPHRLQPMRGTLSSHLLQQLDRELDEASRGPRNVGDAVEADDEALMADNVHINADDIPAQRAAFLKVMRDRFVNGNEEQFDYSKIDEDSDLDDLIELGHDCEDAYFLELEALD